MSIHYNISVPINGEEDEHTLHSLSQCGFPFLNGNPAGWAIHPTQDGKRIIETIDFRTAEAIQEIIRKPFITSSHQIEPKIDDVQKLNPEKFGIVEQYTAGLIVALEGCPYEVAVKSLGFDVKELVKHHLFYPENQHAAATVLKNLNPFIIKHLNQFNILQPDSEQRLYVIKKILCERDLASNMGEAVKAKPYTDHRRDLVIIGYDRKAIGFASAEQNKEYGIEAVILQAYTWEQAVGMANIGYAHFAFTKLDSEGTFSPKEAATFDNCLENALKNPTIESVKTLLARCIHLGRKDA